MKKNKIDSLVIGCGNIGAMYDINSKDILTHCKAISKKKTFNLTIYDLDSKRADFVSNFYSCAKLTNLGKVDNFNVVSICTPTDSHFSLLKKLFTLKTPLVICEKPISNDLKELDIIKLEYLNSKTKVLVNYFRRFHPTFIELRNSIKSEGKKNKLINIVVKYQRGFLNNCSHAIDLIEFLTEEKIDFNNFKITNIVYDNFKIDPTLSMIGVFNNICYSFIGLPNVRYSFFEIELYFQNGLIKIENSGNLIKYYKSQANDGFYLPLIEEKHKQVKNAIKRRMQYVIDESEHIYLNNKNDNFLESLDLNKRMLSILNKQKNG
jgi:predicted dehydrogenase